MLASVSLQTPVDKKNQNISGYDPIHLLYLESSLPCSLEVLGDCVFISVASSQVRGFDFTMASCFGSARGVAMVAVLLLGGIVIVKGFEVDGFGVIVFSFLASPSASSVTFAMDAVVKFAFGETVGWWGCRLLMSVVEDCCVTAVVVLGCASGVRDFGSSSITKSTEPSLVRTSRATGATVE